MSFHWTCPYCDRDTTITESNYSTSEFSLRIKNADGPRQFKSVVVVCPNLRCKKFTFTLMMYGVEFTTSGPDKLLEQLETWNLVPPSSAKVFPNYVPQPIREDYEEACKIRDLSPKASATLSRRCLQGMIRDFWKIKGDNLKEEIEAVEEKLDPLTWKAIDSVRKIGNIGAHMEKDINIIIDVDPKEAQLLIGLIELLVKDWYVTRHQREERLKGIVAVGAAKDAAKNAAKNANTE
jgi:hypothetical protein